MTVSVKLFACRVHGQCSIAKQLPDGVACCKKCPDYKEKDDGIPGRN